MYIHRIVFDANQIGDDRPGIDQLASYDDAGLIELLQTSTLPVEFRTWEQGRLRTKQYPVIGGSALVYVAGTNTPDAQPGTAGGESRFIEIQNKIFGQDGTSEKKRLHDTRDALHLNQATQHDVDFFITNDIRILRR